LIQFQSNKHQVKSRKDDGELKSSESENKTLNQECLDPWNSSMIDNRPLNSQSNIPCRVTHVVSPARLYIISLEDSERFSLFTTALGDALNAKSKSKVELEEPFNVGQTCAALNESKVWARGKVVTLKPGNKDHLQLATVFFWDSGKVREVSTHPDHLRNLPGQFSRDRPFSQPVHMSNIHPTGGTLHWSASACDKLKSWLEAVENIVTFKNDGPQVVDESSGLSSQPVQIFVEKVTSTGPLEPSKREHVSLSRKLRDRGLALPLMNYEATKKTLAITENVEMNVEISLPMQSHKSYSVVEDLIQQVESPIKTFSWKKMKPLEESSFQGITTYVDSRGKIYIQPKQNRETVETVKHILNCKYKDSNPKPHDLFWFPNQCCIAQFDLDKTWYRGRVLHQLDKDLFAVSYVDFGNREVVEAGNLRKNLLVQQIPEQCFQMKLGEIEFCESSEKLNRKVLGFLDKLLVDQTVQVTITKRMPLIGNLKTLAGVDVAEHLVRNGYAVRKKQMLERVLEINESQSNASISSSSDTWSNPELSLSYADAENNMCESANILHTLSKQEDSIAENESTHRLNNCVECKIDGDNNVQEPFGNGCESLNLTFETEDDTDDILESDNCSLSNLSIPLKEGDEFCVVYLGQHSKDIIYCRLVHDDRTSFKTLSGELQLIGEKQKLLLKRPMRGEVVIAQNMLDRKWCRAVMTDPSTMTAQFIDYGNSSVVEEIRRLPQGMRTLPEQAIQLKIVGEINLQSLVALETVLHCQMVKLEKNEFSRSQVASVKLRKIDH